MIIFYFLCYNLPDVCHVLKDLFWIFKISVGGFVHPFLIAGEDHAEYALECCNLKAESMLITIKDSDATLAGHLEGRVCNNFMSIWCLVDVSFGLFNPDKALI
jgi:hypothetical protein